jgi:hypothetical protein
MSSQRKKGTAWETAWVQYLRQHGVPHAERRALAGNLDRGDIAGIVGVVLECKSGAFHLAQWLDEAEQERVNDGADFGIVLAKRAGKASPADGYAILTGAALVQLLQAAGYIATPVALPEPLRVVEPMAGARGWVDPDSVIEGDGLLEALRGLVARYDPPPAVIQPGQPCELCHEEPAVATRGKLAVCAGCRDALDYEQNLSPAERRAEEAAIARHVDGQGGA